MPPKGAAVNDTPELWKATYEADTPAELSDAYRQKMLELEREKAWQLAEMHQEDYLAKEGVAARFCTYRVLDD